MKWIRFLRQYGPIPSNDNMYDEAIQRLAQRAEIRPIVFEHPLKSQILSLFNENSLTTSVVLTGTAGDGKSYLCSQVWTELKGDTQEWSSSENYYRIHRVFNNNRLITVHLIRDLTAFGKDDEQKAGLSKTDLLQKFSQALFDTTSNEIFLLAANDGQLIEAWRKLPAMDYIIKARQVFETLLVEDRQEETGVQLKFFNVSRIASTRLFDLVLEAFLSHEGWQECYAGNPRENEFFSANCPIRHNYELLQSPLVQKRLRSLFELCDYNGIHIPIRQILLLLANAVLGHPDCKDGLMMPTDVPKIINIGTVAKASLYNNIFGANLPEYRQESIPVFEQLNRFRIGHETTNRIDNILIFGEADENLRSYFHQLIEFDDFYGADQNYKAAQRQYVEGADEDEAKNDAFLKQLTSQRQRLFFKIPEDQEEEFRFWELTVFKYAGEYLEKIVNVLKSGRKVERAILARIVRGLNRIFIGMLVASDRELILANSLSFSDAKVSRLLEERISVAPRLGEKVEIALHHEIPTLNIYLAPDIFCSLPLHLVRYEFLSRVAEGALPSSFSKECYEDMLAFKSQIMAALDRRRYQQDEHDWTTLVFRILTLDDLGNPTEETIEVINAS